MSREEIAALLQLREPHFSSVLQMSDEHWKKTSLSASNNTLTDSKDKKKKKLLSALSYFPFVFPPPPPRTRLKSRHRALWELNYSLVARAFWTWRTWDNNGGRLDAFSGNRGHEVHRPQNVWEECRNRSTKTAEIFFNFKKKKCTFLFSNNEIKVSPTTQSPVLTAMMIWIVHFENQRSKIKDHQTLSTALCASSSETSHTFIAS